MAKKDIVVDLGRVTKRQMIAWQVGRREIIDDEDDDSFTLEEFDFKALYGLVVTAWPFGEINFETYLDLSYPDSVRVDQAVMDTITELSKKK